MGSIVDEMTGASNFRKKNRNFSYHDQKMSKVLFHSKLSPLRTKIFQKWWNSIFFLTSPQNHASGLTAAAKIWPIEIQNQRVESILSLTFWPVDERPHLVSRSMLETPKMKILLTFFTPPSPYQADRLFTLKDFLLWKYLLSTVNYKWRISGGFQVPTELS